MGHVRFGEDFVVVGQGVEHLLTPELGFGTKLFGDLGLGDGRAQVLGLVEERLHRDQVDQALELPHRAFGAGADRDLHGDRVALEQPLLDFLKHPVELGADAVELVDEADPRHAVLRRLPPDGFALRLDPLNGREHDDGTVQHAQRSLDLGREVDVSGRVDDIDRDRLAVGIFPAAGDRRRHDRDSPLSLLGEVVGRGVTLVDVPHAVDRAGVVQDSFGRGRLAGVDVGDDADVANRR